MEIKSKTFEYLYDLTANVAWRELDEKFLFAYNDLAVVDEGLSRFVYGVGATKIEAKKDYLEKISHKPLVLREWPNPNQYIKPLIIKL